MFERIRELREDADLTQTDVARHLNCSQRVYSDYERGKVNMPNPFLVKLALFHNVSIDYLLGLTDYKKPYPRSKQLNRL